MRTLLWSIYIAYLRLMGRRRAAHALFHCHHKLRLRILKAFGASIGEGSRINGPLIVTGRYSDLSGLTVGSHTHIGTDALLDLSANISIGSRVAISPRCSIITHLNVGEGTLKEKYPPAKGGIIIEDDVYIGACATILHGAKIGKGALIGACALVTKDVPAHTMVTGIPAKPVKKFST